MRNYRWTALTLVLLASLIFAACEAAPAQPAGEADSMAADAEATEAPAEEEAAAEEAEASEESSEEAADDAMAADYEFVAVPGNFNAQVGCEGDWDPACDDVQLTLGEDGLWTTTLDLTAGEYEGKAAINKGWDINFGKDGAAGGDNLIFSLTEDAPVTFTFDPATNVLSLESEGFAEPLVRADADLVLWVGTETEPVFQALADDFAEEFGISVAVQGISLGEISDVFPIAAPAGEGPDILAMPHDGLGRLVSSGLLTPMDLGEKAEEFSPAAIQAFSFSGERYGVPYATENVALFRNVDIVPDAPETWEDVLAISQERAADNDDDISTNQYGFVRMEGDPYHFYPMMTAHGGYIFGFNDDGSYNPDDVGLDNEGSLAAAQLWDSLLKENLHPPAVDWSIMHDMFESGQSAMTITGPWALERIRESGVNYAISPVPSANETGRPFLGSWGFVVSSFSEQPLLAQVFLTEFVATTETMQGLYEAELRQPAYLPVLEGVDDPDLVAFTEAGIDAWSMPAIPEMAQVWDAWGNAVTLIGQQGDEPVNAFETAAEQIRTLIAENQ